MLDVGLIEGGSQIGSAHGISRRRYASFFSEEMESGKCSSDGSAGVARCRLNPQFLEGAIAQHLAIGNAVERDTSGQAKLAETGFGGQ